MPRWKEAEHRPIVKTHKTFLAVTRFTSTEGSETIFKLATGITDGYRAFAICLVLAKLAIACVTEPAVGSGRRAAGGPAVLIRFQLLEQPSCAAAVGDAELRLGARAAGPVASAGVNESFVGSAACVAGVSKPAAAVKDGMPDPARHW